MNIKRAANHDIRMNDEASARGQPQATPLALRPLLYFRFAASLALPIRGMCQQATIKRLMAISLYAPISVIQSQRRSRRRKRRRRRRPGHMFVVITCELTRRSLRSASCRGEGGWFCLATWPGHVSSIRPQTKCYKFFPLTWSCWQCMKGSDWRLVSVQQLCRFIYNFKIISY